MANRKRRQHGGSTPGATPGGGKSAQIRPPKPWARYPLFAHRNGQWAKKIRGKHCYFGPWADPEAALQAYLDQRDHLQAGIQPPPAAVSLDELANRYLAAQHIRLEDGNITRKHFSECRREAQRMLDILGASTPVDQLGPDQWAHLRRQLARGVSASSLAGYMRRIRAICNWGTDNRLIQRPNWGREFRPPSAQALRQARNRLGERFVDAPTVRALLDAAEKHPYLHACILLGINCGLGVADCAGMRLEHVDLAAGVLDYPRDKTDVPRRAILWPETRQAIADALACRKRRIGKIRTRCPEHIDLIFLTRRYRPLVWLTDAADQVGPLPQAFRKLARPLGIPAGMGFYTLRRTYRTVADAIADQPAIDLTMGHLPTELPGTSAAMADVYRQRIDRRRLFAIAKHVRNWLRTGKS